MLNLIKSHKEFIVGLVLTLSLLWPLAAAPFFSHHDDVQVIRLYEMDKCIKDGQIPCRWVPDLGGLYGYPIFNYYAPLPYYFGEVSYLITNNLILSVKVMFATAFLGSYVFMYLLARKFWGPWGASLSGIFYILAPYHAVNLYVRGAMGELWALMAFPAIFWGFVKLKERICIANLSLNALFVSALFTSHNLSAMLFLPITFIWILILFWQIRAKKFIAYSLAAVFLGVLISSFYLLPMMLEKNLVHVDTTTFGYFSYTEHFKGFRKLILDRSWGWGSSIREVPGGEREGMSYQIGWVHLLGWLISLYLAKRFWRSKRNLSYIIIFSSILILLSMFMINPRSEFIWKAIGPLKFLQFPWRFLLIIIFFISFISGAASLGFVRVKKYLILALILAVTFLNFTYFRPEKFIYTKDVDLLSGKNWDRQIKRSIFDYLPIFAKEPPAELAQERYQILTGETNISDFKEGTNWFKFKAMVKSHSIIRLSQYYFPQWKIFVNGKESNFEYKDNTLGLMTLMLGVGEYDVEGRLYDTPVRSIANLLTLVGLGFVTFLFVLQFKTIRRFVLYYRKGIN